VSERKRITTYLTHRGDDGAQQVVVWDTRDIEVGRSKTQDLVVPDPEVSRSHARFFREGERHFVEDLDSAIGTWVNGERVLHHELQPGDVVRIGAFQIAYGRTDQPLRPGPGTRFASELKSGLADPAAAGRTMLGVDLGDSAVFSAPTDVSEALRSGRVVSADGTLEESGSDDPLGLSLGADLLGAADLVRNLDFELAQSGALRPQQPKPAAEPESVTTCERLTMVLEIETGSFEIAALLRSLWGKDLRHPLLRVRFKKPDPC